MNNLNKINACLKYANIYDINNQLILSGDLVCIQQTHFPEMQFFAIAEYVKIGTEINLLLHIYSQYAYHMSFYKDTRHILIKTSLDQLTNINKQELIFLKKRYKSTFYRSKWKELPIFVSDLPENSYTWNSGFASFLGLKYNNHIDFLFLDKKKLLF